MTTPPPPRSTALRLNIAILRLTRNWMKVALTILAIYIALPWIAPTLMKLGATGPAQVIYNMYRPFCHQFGFRTFFLYGEQPAYPLAEAAQYTGLESFESYVGQSNIPLAMRQNRVPTPPFNVNALPAFYGIEVPANIMPQTPIEDQNFLRFQVASAAFPGNEQMGYKMTLCERDIAIYTTLFIVGLIYSRPFVRRRLRPVPLLLFLWLGVVPIGIDGFSQLLGYPPANFWEARETLPFFRVLTGALFGAMTGWLGFPYLEMSMQDARREIEAKLRVRGIVVE
jgi:uncharacterized membrane protein